MKKLALILLLLTLASCTSGMKGKHVDRMMYDESDPTEVIDIETRSQKEMISREKQESRFSFKRFIQTLMSNESPNRFVPEYPELLRPNDIDRERVFSF